MTDVPDWLHIGSGKSGSTSLAMYLAGHPELFVSPVKEPRHFISPGKRPAFRGPSDEERVNDHLVWDIEAYHRLFADRQPGQLAGELSQTYLGWPDAPAAVHARNPDARIIAVLRQPADRAFSSWSAHRRDGFEPLKHFEDTLAAESHRIAENYAPIWWYTERGWYGRFVARWQELFPPEQFRVWIYEDLVADPQGFTKEILEFLGVDPTWVPDLEKRHNVSLVPRWHGLDSFLRHPSRVRQLMGRVVPKDMRAPIASKIIGSNSRRLHIDPETRRQLTERYRPDIEQLQGLIGRDLSLWLN